MRAAPLRTQLNTYASEITWYSLPVKKYKVKVFYGQEPPSGESTTTECGVNYQLPAGMLLKQPNWELLVAVDHNLLGTMASETVDPIDWSHPPPSWAVPPERRVHSINRCSLSSTGNRSCNFIMRGNHLAHAATPCDMNLIYTLKVCLTWDM